MFVLSEQNSIANNIIAEMRDIDVQKDSFRFRKNLERLGMVLAYELSKKLNYEDKEVQTPLGTASIPHIKDNIVLATILRAGLPFYQGFLNMFDKAESAFIGAYREEEKDGSTEISINMEYMAAPQLAQKELIIIDPMLATGKSLLKTTQALLKNGTPNHIHFVSAIASKPGIAFLNQHMENFTIWTGAVDDQLNNKAFIVPGLGDAGDLSFGEKT